MGVTPAIACTVAYVTVWDTEYHDHENEVCETVYEQVCNTELQRLCKPTTRQECTTNYVEECSTIYKNICVQKYRTEYEPYTETECTTEYKQDCQYEWQGEGNDKVWAPIDGTCQNVPYDECKEVEKTHARQVAYEACHEQPEESCVSVPKESCITVADEICQSEPLTKCGRAKAILPQGAPARPDPREQGCSQEDLLHQRSPNLNPSHCGSPASCCPAKTFPGSSGRGFYSRASSRCACLRPRT